MLSWQPLCIAEMISDHKSINDAKVLFFGYFSQFA